jgi:hypothetical protein
MALSQAELAKAERLQNTICNADRKALCSRNGAGNYSTAAFLRLKHNGLVDDSFMLTDLGWEVRIRVGGGRY